MRRAAPPRSSGLFPLALAALAASIALAACADRPPPQAVINDISPASGRVDQAQVVQINGANFGVRVFTDFNDPSQSHADDVYRVAVGGLSLTGVQHIDSTELTGTLPAGVPDGPNDVVVTDPWDRVSMLTGAYFGLPAGGPPTLLAITSGPANVPLLACAAATIQQRNAAGAPSVWITPTTITLATNPSASFGIFGDSSCSTAITSTTIDPGQTEVVVYVQSSTRRTASLVASGTGLAPASRSFVFGPTLLAFTTGPFTNIPLSVCTPFPIQVETRDPAGTPSAVNAPTAVTLAVAPTTGLSLYDTAGCNGGPVGQITIPTGASTAGFFFKGSATGTYNVTAASTGFTGATQNGEQVVIGTANAFAFTPISTQAVGAPFPITIEAQDGFGNLVSSYTGTATLAGQGGPTVTCIIGCAGNTTGAFAFGRWSGWVTASPAGAGASIRATSGASITGTSAAFAVVAPDAGLGAPVARLLVSPGAVGAASDNVFLDARLSYDPGGAALQYSFDPLGNATTDAGTPPGWTAWSTTGTSSGTNYTGGNTVYAPRVAVREAANPAAIAYAAATVVSNTNAVFCTVTTTSLVDDGASSCSNGTKFGTDNNISLTEAIALTNTGGGRVITTATPLRIVYDPAAAPVTISNSTILSFASGTQLVNAPFVFTGNGALVANADVTGSRAWSVTNGTTQLSDVIAYDFAGFITTRLFGLRRLLMLNCSSSAPCVDATNGMGALDVHSSEFRDAPGIALRAAPATPGGGCPATAMDVESTTFTRTGTAIQEDCTSGSRVVHATFHANGVGISYSGGTANVLQNSIFSANTTATSCGSATFTAQDYNLTSGNGADGCAGAGSSTTSGDPLYFIPEASDFRVRPGSPARDSAFDLGLDLTDAAPGSFFGAGPDRGGRETP